MVGCGSFFKPSVLRVNLLNLDQLLNQTPLRFLVASGTFYKLHVVIWSYSRRRGGGKSTSKPGLGLNPHTQHTWPYLHFQRSIEERNTTDFLTRTVKRWTNMKHILWGLVLGGVSVGGESDCHRRANKYQLPVVGPDINVQWEEMAQGRQRQSQQTGFFPILIYF